MLVNLYLWLSWLFVWLSLLFIWRMPQQRNIWALLFLKSLGTLLILQVLQTATVSKWMSQRKDEMVTLLPFYTDWLWTTPLTLVILWQLANLNVDFLKWEQPVNKQLMPYISLDLLMLVFGTMAERTDGFLRVLLFVAAGLCLTYLLVLIWRELYPQALQERHAAYRTFVVSALFITCSWLYFPLIWLLGPLALGWLSAPAMYDLIALGNLGVKSGLYAIIVIGLWRKERNPHDETHTGNNQRLIIK